MLLKFLFLLIVLYYVVRTSRALIRAIAGETRTSSTLRDDPARTPSESEANRRGDHQDIEDAKYVDIT